MFLVLYFLSAASWVLFMSRVRRHRAWFALRPLARVASRCSCAVLRNAVLSRLGLMEHTWSEGASGRRDWH